MRKKRRVLLILAISLILIAIIFAFAIEKALNSVLPPEMVKQLIDDEDLKSEINKIVGNVEIPHDVQKFVYENTSDDNKNIKISSNDETSDNLHKDKNNISSQKTSSQTEESNNSSNNAVNKNDIRADSTTNSSNGKSSTKISPIDQIEAIRIVLSAMTTSEIKDLIALYKSGKKQEAIQRGINILRSRLNIEQKRKLLEIYNKTIK